ncbi:hypothetical protein SISSUDRAFT_1068190 [Sistotremastrum suecicum HHB10207 ss-3]|uniref:Uncharacterized protein n=1 Tax=Sistotremastrum suecicum HHB10207 ss-3 TaxID=1314776 RepID=A0A165WE05_9AGAM|nr:hypothetical protein SISSUDRAFT_1068190 [Sistotremastrum suecicum HHB10207 ss-3]
MPKCPYCTFQRPTQTALRQHTEKSSNCRRLSQLDLFAKIHALRPFSFDDPDNEQWRDDEPDRDGPADDDMDVDQSFEPQMEVPN